jgi:hypothetical protein
MTATVIFASFLVAASPVIHLAQAPAPAQKKFSHADQIAAYASAIVGTAQAEKLCPGYRRNPTNMAALRSWMAIQDADKAALQRETTAAVQKMGAQIKSIGATSWCSSIVGLFGPEGTLARGLLDAK